MTDEAAVDPFPAAVGSLQGAVLAISYGLARLMHRRRPQGFVVGLQEIAGVLGAIGDALGDEAVTVNLESHPYYDRTYDIEYGASGRKRLFHRVRRLLGGPWLLGRLAARYQTFIYVGGLGFLVSKYDGRERELAFLRAHGRRVVCYFTGSEIRSHVLLDELGRSLGRDVVTTYQRFVNPALLSDGADRRRRALAAAADRHANVVFNASVDQLSYLTRPTNACLYFCPDDAIRRRPDKWAKVERPVVVHAPSSPLIKGTPIVRAAVRALHEQGYDFEYVELIGRPHGDVLAELERAHVVLNEFYALVPGMFGVEAMAANAVLLTSADADLEPTLADGANAAWVVTPYWQVERNLRGVLEDPSRWQEQADRGTEWVRRNCSRSADRARLLSLLNGG